MIFKTQYKNFEIEGLKVVRGFNTWTLTLITYKNRGFKEEEYFLKIIDTYTPIKKEALKEAFNFIDNLKVIPFKSSGLTNCPYLRSVTG